MWLTALHLSSAPPTFPYHCSARLFLWTLPFPPPHTLTLSCHQLPLYTPSLTIVSAVWLPLYFLWHYTFISFLFSVSHVAFILNIKFFVIFSNFHLLIISQTHYSPLSMAHVDFSYLAASSVFVTAMCCAQRCWLAYFYRVVPEAWCH